jgi:hypothetical protein
LLGLLFLLLLGSVLGGCVSSRSPEATAEARSEVVGVWEYRTQGTGALQRGTLLISVVDGRLVGRLRDSWRGQLRAQVRVHGNQLELELDGLRISGRVRGGEFQASIRRAFDEMSVQPYRRGAVARFVARRVRSSSGSSQDHYGCRSLLYEHSYLCSPFDTRGSTPLV